MIKSYNKYIFDTKTNRNKKLYDWKRSGKSYMDIAFDHFQETGERLSTTRIAKVISTYSKKYANE